MPKMEPLLRLLDHPQGASACEKLLNSSSSLSCDSRPSFRARQGLRAPVVASTESGGEPPKEYALPSQLAEEMCSACYGAHVAMQGYSPCKELHWGCVLQWMSGPTVQVSEEGKTSEIPRFCTQPARVQYNFLTLLMKQKHRVPRSLVESFVSVIRGAVPADYDPWLTFLLRQVDLYVIRETETAATSSATTTVYTALSAEALARVTALAETLQTTRPHEGIGGAPEVGHAKRRRDHSVRVLPLEALTHGDHEGYEQVRRVESLEAISHGHHEVHEPGRLVEPMEVLSEGSHDVGEEVMEEPAMEVQDDVTGEQEHVPLGPSYVDGNSMETGSPEEESSNVEHTEDVALMCALCRLHGSWLQGQPSNPGDLEQLLSQSAEELKGVLKRRSVAGLGEDAVIAVISSIVSLQLECCYQSTAVLLQTTVLPQLQSLGQCASRPLISSLITLATKLPAITISGVLLPLAISTGFGAAQCDAVVKVLKGCPQVELKNNFWRELVCCEKNDSQEPFVWSESVVSVVQTLVDHQVSMDGAVTSGLVQSLQRSALHLNKSAKFAKLLIDIIKKHKPELAPYALSLAEIAGAHKSMMKPTLTRAIKNINSK